MCRVKNDFVCLKIIIFSRFNDSGDPSLQPLMAPLSLQGRAWLTPSLRRPSAWHFPSVTVDLLSSEVAAGHFCSERVLLKRMRKIGFCTILPLIERQVCFQSKENKFLVTAASLQTAEVQLFKKLNERILKWVNIKQFLCTHWSTVTQMIMLQF